jgi:hypothetical protein
MRRATSESNAKFYRERRLTAVEVTGKAYRRRTLAAARVLVERDMLPLRLGGVDFSPAAGGSRSDAEVHVYDAALAKDGWSTSVQGAL